MVSRRLACSILSAALFLALPVRSDTLPNDNKANAEPLSIFQGVLPTLGTTSSTDPDYYGAQVVDLGQIDVLLTVSNTGTTGLTVDLLGLQQVNGGITTTEVNLQSQLVPAGQSRALRWYALNPIVYSRVFVKVLGTAATATSYQFDATTAPIPIPQAVPGFFAPGSITITTQGQTLADTDFWVYNLDFGALSGAGNDDMAVSNPASRLVRTYTNGRYYIAISDTNLANLHAAPVGDGQQNAAVTDFADVLVATSSAAAASLNLTIDDGSGAVAVVVTKPGAHGVAFVSFQVGPPPTTGTVGSFCHGDGLDPNVMTPCPCNNFGAPGNGCENSFGVGGANLVELGGAVFKATQMPATVAHIYFQGDGYSDAVFGDGVRCTGGNLIRLRLKIALAGLSIYPEAGDPDVATRGQVTAGSGRRYYQVFYRNASAAFCPPATFNATNGWILDW